MSNNYEVNILSPAKITSDFLNNNKRQNLLVGAQTKHYKVNSTSHRWIKKCLVILVNELVQTRAERNLCSKFEEIGSKPRP